jgi:ABC-2 type transport system ATP-binding protein
MNLIEVSNISKTFKVLQRDSGLKNAFKALFSRNYKLIKAVDDISFNIKKGEIVAYIGPNGAGKSTTIKILCGILNPDSGKCMIEEMNPFDDRIKYVSKIGVVFGQKSQLWWDIPVADSFDLLKAIYKIPDDEYEKNRHELTELLNLNEILRTPVRQLSLGQRMRAEIAASLLHNPRILFLDEPTIGLDAVSKVAVRNFIKKINMKRKVTVILTSHDMADVEALTNRVIVIGNGKKLYDGSLNEIKKKYSKNKRLEIICDKVPSISKLDGVDIIESSYNRILLNVNVEKISISSVITIYSELCEINDINVLEESIDNIIIKLYEEYHI